MIIVRLLSPEPVGWISTTNFTRSWEPTSSWNQYHSFPPQTEFVLSFNPGFFGAYNGCDLQKFGSFFPENVEFYHDQSGGGPMTREQLVAAIKQNICGKVHRELVSIEVFPMKNYGAIGDRSA